LVSYWGFLFFCSLFFFVLVFCVFRGQLYFLSIFSSFWCNFDSSYDFWFLENFSLFLFLVFLGNPRFFFLFLMFLDCASFLYFCTSMCMQLYSLFVDAQGQRDFGRRWTLNFFVAIANLLMVHFIINFYFANQLCDCFILKLVMHMQEFLIISPQILGFFNCNSARFELNWMLGQTVKNTVIKLNLSGIKQFSKLLKFKII